MNKRRVTSVISNVLLLVITFFLIGYFNNSSTYSYTKSKSEESPYSWIQLYNELLVRVKKEYVIDIPTKELIQYSINGMTKVLDPHTNYFEEKQYKDLMVQTKGKFGGLGIIISKRNNHLTVISPIPETPAYKLGIQAGDQIVSIDDSTTKGLSLQGAVNKLRGKKGTIVNIKIKRNGVAKLIDYAVKRDIIKIKSVPFFTTIDDKYGYIRLVSFSSNTGADLRAAVDSIKMKLGNKLKGVVLDLRNNPGGLLSQAVSSANVFLPKNSVIVSTKGRVSPEEKLKAKNNFLLDKNVKVVVMVNEGSASAAEIVSGAIQDWDRGVIVGRRSYGKGSVQTIMPLMNTESGTQAIKMTIAYYYTPSGRCINRIANSAGYELYKKGDSTILKNSIFDTNKIYYTKILKREVKAGGGIKPDIIFPIPRYDLFKINLEAKSLFFGFALDYKSKHKKIDRNFKVNEKIFNEFLSYMKSKKFKYESEEEIELLSLFKRTLLNIKSNIKLDSLKLNNIMDSLNVYDKSEYQTYKDLYDLTQKHKREISLRDKKYIIDGISREILGVYFGQKGKYSYVTDHDKEVLKAVKVFSTSYDDVLKKKK